MTDRTPTTPSVVLSASRAGIGSVVLFQDNITRTEIVADVGVVQQTGTAVNVSVTLAETIASSDLFSYPLFVTLSDSISSSDSVIVGEADVGSLSDTVSSSDIFFAHINFNALYSDSIVSSDFTDGHISYFASYSDNGLLTDSGFLVQSYFTPSLADTISSFDTLYGYVSVSSALALECGPIPVFPPLPAGFPVKLSVVMDTTLGTTKSLREMRVAQQTFPLWDLELPFEELLDQTQNQILYSPFMGFQQYEELVQTFLMMYGQTGIFAFNAPWDYSRTDQYIAIGDGITMDFPIFRTWATGSVATAAPIGMVDTVTNVKLNGAVVDPTLYVLSRSYIHFSTPPTNGETITMTLSFYYLCRFVADEQDYDEFSKNRWTVPSLKFRAVYWPGCQ